VGAKRNQEMVDVVGRGSRALDIDEAEEQKHLQVAAKWNKAARDAVQQSREGARDTLENQKARCMCPRCIQIREKKKRRAEEKRSDSVRKPGGMTVEMKQSDMSSTANTVNNIV
jgi:hypothetical protein